MKGSGSGGARGLRRHTALESGATKGKEEGLTTEAQRAQRKDEGVGKRGRSWFGKTQTHHTGERRQRRAAPPGTSGAGLLSSRRRGDPGLRCAAGCDRSRRELADGQASPVFGGSAACRLNSRHRFALTASNFVRCWTRLGRSLIVLRVTRHHPLTSRRSRRCCTRFTTGSRTRSSASASRSTAKSMMVRCLTRGRWIRPPALIIGASRSWKQGSSIARARISRFDTSFAMRTRSI